MLKSLILFLVFLEIVFSRAPSEELVCKNEENRFNMCLKNAQNELPENPNQDTHIQSMEQIVACLGNLKCKGVVKYQKFYIEYQLHMYKFMEKIQCATLESQPPLVYVCSVSTDIACDQQISITSGCNNEEKKTLSNIFKTHRYNSKAIYKVMQEQEGVENFNFDFTYFD